MVVLVLLLVFVGLGQAMTAAKCRQCGCWQLCLDVVTLMSLAHRVTS